MKCKLGKIKCIPLSFLFLFFILYDKLVVLQVVVVMWMGFFVGCGDVQ